MSPARGRGARSGVARGRKGRRKAGRRRAAAPRWGRGVVLLLACLALFALGLGLGQRWSRSRGGAAVEPTSKPEASSPAAAASADRRPDSGPAAANVVPEPGPPSGPFVSLVVDDLGRTVQVLEELDALEIPLTYSILPFETRSADVAARLRRSGAEVLCHLPMQAAGDADPGPGALLASMSRSQLRAATERALQAVPGAVGVNNHMGSTLSRRSRPMSVVLDVLAERDLFFLDSRTSPDSVAYRLALERGLPTAERHVFLDADLAPEAVRGEFRRLLALADERGSAIAIGHPHAATLEVLRYEVPRARALGYRFVPVSYLLDRQGAGPGS